MTANNHPRQLSIPKSPTASTLDSRSRRDSLASISVASQVGKEQLAQTLDKIHTSASQSGVLTTFNDFAPPPGTVSTEESKGSSGDLVQQSLSGLYSRLKEAVGVVAKTPAQEPDDAEGQDGASRKGSGLMSSVSSYTRGESGATNSTFNSNISTDPTSVISSSGMATSESQSHMQSSKASSITNMTASKSTSSASQNLPKIAKAALPSAVTSAIDPVTVSAFKDPKEASRGLTSRTEEPFNRSTSQRSVSKQSDGSSVVAMSPNVSLDNASFSDRMRGSSRSRAEDGLSIDGSTDTPMSPANGAADARVPRTTSRLSAFDPALDPRKRPMAIDRISMSRARNHSRSSSMEPGTAEPSPINSSAHNSIYHDSFAHNERPEKLQSGAMRIPGTTTNQGAVVSARLESMRKQVLSKEFWMADDTCRECFLCGNPFNAFRRKHHCRTCGCIFDNKCTAIISGEKFGVAGTLRVCKTCLDIINRRYDSGSDDSGDEAYLPVIFKSKIARQGSESKPKAEDEMSLSERPDVDDARSATTPMMAIPATRRVGHSAVLEIDAPQLSRPSSSRSLKSLAGQRPQSSGHRRHHSKHNFLNRFKSSAEERAPFRTSVNEELGRKSKLSVFHDDNIIDPELAPYMSDESSGDEQMSIVAMMNGSDLQPSSLDPDRNFGPYLNANRRHRFRHGEKSVSALSLTSREHDDKMGPPSLAIQTRSARRRNLSTASASIHHLRSPRPKSGVFKGPSASAETLALLDHSGPLEPPTLNRSDSNQEKNQSARSLSGTSLNHIRKLFRQLLEDANIPNPSAWEKALIPILIRTADDVEPKIIQGDDMDIRHYVKLKKIPGGRPSDTTYVQGVVFTKNLVLKSMPRKMAGEPRIVIVSFPIEYQRQPEQHFMSLQPVIEQEKEFLRVVVNRIIAQRPHVLLAEKSVSGLALQYLSEANIAVAYNVKPSVIEAVSRMAKTEIISSLDMLALPVHVGHSGGFEVKTYSNSEIKGKKKTYIFVTGCDRDLGCTIALRGGSQEVLSRMKKITEFMVYVVYNLKLESCLLRDEFILLPADVETPSPQPASRQATSDWHGLAAARVGSAPVSQTSDEPDLVTTSQISESENPSQSNSSLSEDAEQPVPDRAAQTKRLVSLHESHSHASHDSIVPEDVPMPTFYSDMVAKYETRILSASPFVRFTQPYLLMRAREQERRLTHLRRLRDQDIVEDLGESESSDPEKFQLIKPEMVHEIGQKAPRQIMEILHAVHDAEYDKALHNYRTQTRHWENYIQGSVDLFNPYSHQNIVVLFSVTCTATKIPCIEPEVIVIDFYDEHPEPGMDPDCTLGQYVEHLSLTAETICHANGCDKQMWEHHRTYVHDEARITVFVEHNSPLPVGFIAPSLATEDSRDDIYMWSFCKFCKKEFGVHAMSDSAWRYSFGKYLELSFWSQGLRLHEETGCPHDHQKDHLKYFYYRGNIVRVHYDPVDLFEIIVPRPRITWKVDHDLKLKNEIFTRYEERWNKFMLSVEMKLQDIRIDSVLPDKAEQCRLEIEQLRKKAQEDKPALLRRLQETYMNSKYYEIIPLNVVMREMLEKAGEWDAAFAKLEADFVSDKDVRQLTIMQLKKIFTDNESKESLPTTDGTTSIGSESEEKTPATTQTSVTEGEETPSQPSDSCPIQTPISPSAEAEIPSQQDVVLERVEPLDLATPTSPTLSKGPLIPQDESPVLPKAGGEQAVSAAPPAPTPATKPSDPEPPVPNPDMSLSEKVERLRKRTMSTEIPGTGARGENPPTADKAQRPIPERGSSRRAGLTVSPPMVRAISQPSGTLPRTQSSIGKLLKEQKEQKVQDSTEYHRTSTDSSLKSEKKFSDRIGLSALKGHRKGASSRIPQPQYSHGTKKRESKVSALARHFEQLSREFERERNRDKKQRAAKLHHSRAFLPRSSTKAIVEVYEDVDQAVQEPGPSDDDHLLDREQADKRSVDTSNTHETSQKDSPTKELSTPLVSPTGPPSQAEETATEAETDDNRHESQAGSDDEGAGSDADQSSLTLDDLLPGVKEIADSLEPSGEIPEELPKHQKKSLMTMLTNFWAERSASGWSQLEYPLNATDHIFIDSDVIVREDEPSSLIALALSSEDYQAKLAASRDQWKKAARAEHNANGTEKDLPVSDSGEAAIDENELEKSLLRITGTHLKYQFQEGSAKMLCKIFYAEQFDALRRKCGISERIIESLSRCKEWDSKGGKTKSVFLKTLDNRLVMKALSPIETSAFLQFAPAYFEIMAEALFHDLPSVIAKMVGFFQVIIKNPLTNTEMKLDLLVMENLFYDRSPSRTFDLKGSMRNRKIQSTGEQNEVLLDENMVEYIYESPLFVREHSKRVLRASVWNDTLFLARQDVMDYSLMVAVDESRRELVVGMIDCIRTYTWDKRLESWIKYRGFAGGGRNKPTVTSPKEYKSRFREAMARYILQAPNCWHQFNSHAPTAPRARFEGDA
ncbi:hypothetical protein GQ53DRAFT_830310 [Thozetella sp. PMI_491]|nr:hypothetical protein GQ53DRAFT_830310 [Thozetella sp. PMI_491]